jgi:hypothetical protein
VADWAAGWGVVLVVVVGVGVDISSAFIAAGGLALLVVEIKLRRLPVYVT